MSKKTNLLITVFASIFISALSVFILTDAQNQTYLRQNMLFVNGTSTIDSGLLVNFGTAPQLVGLGVGQGYVGIYNGDGSFRPQAPLDVNGWIRASGARFNTTLIDGPLTLSTSTGVLNFGYGKTFDSKQGVCVDDMAAIKIHKNSDGRTWVEIGGASPSGVWEYNCGTPVTFSTMGWNWNFVPAFSKMLLTVFYVGRCGTTAHTFQIDPSWNDGATKYDNVIRVDGCWGGADGYDVSYILENEVFSSGGSSFFSVP